MRRYLFATVIGTSLVALAVVGPSFAQTEKPVVDTSKAEVSRGGAADPNVKSDRAVNSKAGTPRMAPPEKGGERARGGATCNVHIDNRSALYIQVWVDGNPEGMMGPWGDIYTWALAGPTRLYARADFDDGTRLTWGPQEVRCPAGTQYTWRLTR